MKELLVFVCKNVAEQFKLMLLLLLLLMYICICVWWLQLMAVFAYGFREDLRASNVVCSGKVPLYEEEFERSWRGPVVRSQQLKIRSSTITRNVDKLSTNTKFSSFAFIHSFTILRSKNFNKPTNSNNKHYLREQNTNLTTTKTKTIKTNKDKTDNSVKAVRKELLK